MFCILAGTLLKYVVNSNFIKTLLLTQPMETHLKHICLVYNNGYLI